MSVRQLSANGKFITAALGDTYPQTIHFINVNGVNPNGPDENRKNDKMLSGTLPGGTTGSLGRIGGLQQHSTNVFSLTYARAAGTLEKWAEPDPVTNNIKELGLLIFDDDLNKKAEVQILNTNDVRNVHSAMFGNEILIGWSTHQRESSWGAPLWEDSVQDDDTMYLMSVNKEGQIMQSQFEFEMSTSASDDWEVLSDGTVMWTYVNDDGTLKVFSITPDSVGGALPTTKEPTTKEPEPPQECVDDPTWKDDWHWNCSMHKLHDCYSYADITDVLEKCPKTCCCQPEPNQEVHEDCRWRDQ